MNYKLQKKKTETGRSRSVKLTVMPVLKVELGMKMKMGVLPALRVTAAIRKQTLSNIEAA